MDTGWQHSSPMHPYDRENKERQDMLEKEDRRKKNKKKLLHLKLAVYKSQPMHKQENNHK